MVPSEGRLSCNDRKQVSGLGLTGKGEGNPFGGDGNVLYLNSGVIVWTETLTNT